MEYRDEWERFACSGRVEDYLSYKETGSGRIEGHSEEDSAGNRMEEGRYAGLYHGDGNDFKNRSRQGL